MRMLRVPARMAMNKASSSNHDCCLFRLNAIDFRSSWSSFVAVYGLKLDRFQDTLLVQLMCSAIAWRFEW